MAFEKRKRSVINQRFEDVVIDQFHYTTIVHIAASEGTTQLLDDVLLDPTEAEKQCKSEEIRDSR